MTTIAARWEHFPHGADIGVRGIAPTKEGALEQAALALAAIVAELEAVAPRDCLEIACEAPDAELVLVDWLNALVYEMATRRMLFRRFEVELEGGRLRGRAWGEPIDAVRHQLGVEVKGATYTALSLRQDSSGEWIAECVVDV